MSPSARSPVTFYFDFSSPYGFIASRLVERLTAVEGVELSWRPFLLGEVYKRYGSSPRLQPLKFAYEMSDCLRTAAYRGIQDMRIPREFPSSPVVPSRLFYILAHRGEGVAVEYAKEVYTRYFATAPSDHDLKSIAVDVLREGFPDAEVLLAEEQTEPVKQMLRERTDDAIQAGVFGSPFFICDDMPFWGSDRIDQLEAHLRREVTSA